MIRRNRPIGNIVQQLSDGANKLTKGDPFYTKNVSPKREFDVNNTSIDELANVLATLLSDLKAKGIIQ